LAVALASGGISSLSADSNGTNVPFTPVNGTISIATPEPSFMLPMACVLLIGFIPYRFRAKAAR
jgi:hypothetical protein